MSYWDRLPEEMKQLIVRYAESQTLIDHRESGRSRELCNEIEWYDLVRERWGIGHIHVKPGRKRDGSPYVYIFAHYVDLKGRKQRVFLDFDYRSAYYRCNAIRWNMMKGVIDIVL